MEKKQLYYTVVGMGTGNHYRKLFEFTLKNLQMEIPNIQENCSWAHIHRR